MIQTLLEIGISNAVIASVLATAAFIVTRRMRPQWALAVWLLVLAKLLMPPLWTAPLGSLRTPAMVEPRAEFIAWEQAPPALAPATPENIATRKIPLDQAPVAVISRQDPTWSVSLPGLLLAVWIVGTACWLSVAVRRVRSFSELLRHTRAAPATLQAEINALAGESKLRQAPALRITGRPIAPLVWAFSRRPIILLPAALLERLSDEERGAILRHELAHLRRRDHLAKLLELAAVAVYWWLPVAWWARREAERAIEGCCDAEVVARLPGLSRGYASAIVKTIDFLSESSEPLPLGASGFSQFRHVSRRIEMILQPTPIARSSWRHRLALLLLGTAVLPFSIRSLWAEPPAESKPVAAPSAANPGDAEAAPLAPPGLAALWKFRAGKLLDLKHLERARQELAKLESAAGDPALQRLVQTRNELRKKWTSLAAAYQVNEADINQSLSIQREWLDAHMAITRAVFPKTPAGREQRTLCDFTAYSDAMISAKELYAHARLRRGTADQPSDDEQKARDQFQFLRQQYAALVNDLYSVPAFESEAQTLRFMLGELDKDRIAAADRVIYAIQGPPTSSRNIYLDPPSDDEVLLMYRQKCGNDRRTLPERHLRIVKHRMAHYTDPPIRNYPVSGQAFNSHTLYKCTLNYQDRDGNDHRDVMYVDHHHLHFKRPLEPERRDSHEQRKTSKLGTDPRFRDEFSRIPIVGPVTTGEKIIALDPPSDKDVLDALAIKIGRERRSLPGKTRQIVKEQVATYAEPPKWYPSLFGKGQRHHAHYECTVYYDDPQGKSQTEVVYVDHVHLHQPSISEIRTGSVYISVHRDPGAIARVQFRHHQLQVARNKAKLEDLKKQGGIKATATQLVELEKLQRDIAVRQRQLDAATRRAIQFAVNPAGAQ